MRLCPRGPQGHRRLSNMDLIPLLCLMFPWFGATSETRYVNVPEGDDALLPCTLNSGRSINKFDWRKDNGEGEKLDVVEYENRPSFKDTKQDKQFKGRVSFSKDQLKVGDASIIIKDTRLEDNGTYTCGELKEEGRVSITLNVGAARLPYIQTISDEYTWRLLECRVKGVPKPEVEWRNSAGEELAKYVQESEDEQHSPVQLMLKVTKSDNYTCVATQSSIFHQINNTLPVRISGAARKPYIETRDQITWKELKCTVEGIPKPEIEWRNSAGEVLLKSIPKNEEGPSNVELKVNVTKSDNYTCVATQWDIFHQINDTQEVIIPVIVAVSEGGDAVLRCSLNSNQNIKSMKFFWSNANREVFSYDRGIIEQGQQFRERLEYFQQELGSGNASIKIYNIQKSDSGRYTCNFPDIQKSHVELYVVEHSSGLIITVAVITIVILLLVFGSIIAVLIKKIHSLKELTLRPPESDALNPR